MRTITITLILCFIAMPLHAEDWLETCDRLGGMATTIMKNRQAGVSMAEMMKVTAGGKNQSVNSVAETLIISAYDSPRYSTEGMQKRAIEEFRDGVYLECVKTMRSQKD